jgi:hypothetical protein
VKEDVAGGSKLKFRRMYDWIVTNGREEIEIAKVTKLDSDLSRSIAQKKSSRLDVVVL